MSPKSDLIGQTLAHYEITAHLGSGGMGEVYRARDTKLARDVAVKVLPEAFTGDPDRVARFEREATTLAKLQHTHIATVYGFERDAVQPFLVMELVEGLDLAERLKQGPLPVDEALHLAGQIAEGLEAAHALGVVHRDLKPANIKLTPAGDVKILDFGLAKAYAAEGDPTSTIEISNSPTMTAGMTLAGTIIGTAAYMSPEQARGKHIDRQSDVWAFGTVLFEMLTGSRLFGGETVSDSIGAILHRDPDLDRLPPVPAQVRTLLRRCLARDRKQRLRDMGDARLELADAEAALGAPADAGTGRSDSRTPWVIAAVLALAVVAVGFWALTRDTTTGPREVTLGLPRDEAIQMHSGSWPRFVFSPDGQSVLHAGDRDQGLFLRPVDGFASTPVPGIDDAHLFAYSPDGAWIVYTTGQELEKIAVSGGAPTTLCETPSGPGLAWGDGEIYFSRGGGGGLWAVPADGGEPRQISQLDPARDETSHRWPHVLPGGRHLLFTIKTARITTFDDALVAVLSLDTGDVEVLVEGGTFPRYLPTGHLLYARGEELLAVPFDLDTRRITGTPTPVLDGLVTVPVNGAAQFDLSPTGDLAYLPADGPLIRNELVWLHSSGRITRQPVTDTNFFRLDLSPDGRQLVGMRALANDEIHLYDLERHVSTRLTRTPGNDDSPMWSPDGRHVVYTNDRNGDFDLYLVAADGNSPPRRLLESPRDEYPETWGPDSRELLFSRMEDGGDLSLWSLDVTDPDTAPRRLFDDGVSRAWANLSPDGRRLAFVSDFGGVMDVYVCRYPELDRTVRVSTRGGIAPIWSHDGGTLYFETESAFMRAELAADPGGRYAAAVSAPDTTVTLDENMYGPYSLAPDGERFLGHRTVEGSDRRHGIRVVFGWMDGLRGLAR